MAKNDLLAQKAKKPAIKPLRVPTRAIKPQINLETLDILLQRAIYNPDSISPANSKYLQRTIGNQALGQLIQGSNESAANTTVDYSLQHMLDSQARTLQPKLSHLSSPPPIQQKPLFNTRHITDTPRIEIQRTPIAANVLNVVGEDHPRSDKIEDIEKKYLKTRTGSDNFWDETDFRVGEKQYTDYIRDRRKKGDPTWLHVESFLAILNGRIDWWVAHPNHDAGKDEWYNNIFVYGWHDSVKEFMWDIGKYVQTGYFDLTEDEIQKFTDNRDSFDQADKHFETLREAVQKGDMDNRAALIGNARDALRAFTQAVYINIRTMQQVNDGRHDHMHASANQEANTPGAWKVGSKHANVLDTDNKYNNKNYNVTPQGEFENELKAAGYEDQMRAAGYFDN